MAFCRDENNNYEDSKEQKSYEAETMGKALEQYKEELQGRG